MDLWLNGPKMAWILDLTWVKYIQVEWAPFLSINASLTVKSLKIMPKMAQTMAIFRHKWLIKWQKKIILINIQLLMSSGQLLIPIKYLEVPFAPACFIVWPALWNRPAPLIGCQIKINLFLFCIHSCGWEELKVQYQSGQLNLDKIHTIKDTFVSAFNMCRLVGTANLDSSPKAPIRIACSANRGPRPVGVGRTPERSGLQGSQWPPFWDLPRHTRLAALLQRCN